MGFLDQKRLADRAARAQARADLKARAEAARSPTAATEQVSATLDAFRARSKEEAKRYADATDSEYWVAVCFHSRADKEAFLREFNLRQHGDKYLDGYKVAAELRAGGGDPRQPADLSAESEGLVGEPDEMGDEGGVVG
jgi:hypothetical protein